MILMLLLLHIHHPCILVVVLLTKELGFLLIEISTVHLPSSVQQVLWLKEKHLRVKVHTWGCLRIILGHVIHCMISLANSSNVI